MSRFRKLLRTPRQQTVSHPKPERGESSQTVSDSDKGHDEQVETEGVNEGF